MYKFKKVHQTDYGIGKVASLQLINKNLLTEQPVRKVVILVADANGVLYVDNMEAYSLVVATSCLVQPLAGDRVCVVVDGSLVVITDILFRQQENEIITLGDHRATLRIVASEIELCGGKRLTINTPELTLLARSSRWIAETLQQISQRLFVRSQHASRQIAQTDEVMAKHIVQDAQQSFVMKSEIGSLKSSSVLKIDGGQVHVG
ncbi:TPA: DUF3540 domain-containing protein [Serratia liquefaciens]